MRLTAKNVHTLPLPESKKEHVYSDDAVPGFLLRIREGGSRRLIFQYKLAGVSKKITLGSVTALDFTETRKTAEKLYAQVKLGEDPASDRAEAKLKAAETFEVIARRFLEYQHTALRPRSYSDVERHLLVHSRDLHGLQLAKVERRDVATVIAGVAKNSGTVTGNRVRTTLSSLYSWAIGEGLVELNPVTGTNRAGEKARDRVLTPAELALIWNNLRDDHDHYSAIVRLLMLTAQRASEIADLRWSEIVENQIKLPASRTKNTKPHSIPLSAPARAIIEAQPRRTNADGRPRDLIFGIAEGGFSGWHPCKQRLDERIAKAVGEPLPGWVHHDLRRSAATHMGALSVQPHVIECVLNHAGGFRSGVHGIYNKNPYTAEMAIALDLWADRLMAIVKGQASNVVPLRA
jgi:integrase